MYLASCALCQKRVDERKRKSEGKALPPGSAENRAYQYVVYLPRCSDTTEKENDGDYGRMCYRAERE